MIRLITTAILVISSLSFYSIKVYAQFPPDPSLNLKVCDVNGDQALSKIVSTSDGGCYISWFDQRSGSYHVYLQRLDIFGNKHWATDGLLISSHPQQTYIVDYDLIVDQYDNAILVFSDARNAGNLNPVAYKISPAGDFLWGADGISLNPTSDFQPNPKAVETTDGFIVVTWIIGSTPTKVALQKLSPTGFKMWGANPILISSASEGYNYPALVRSDNGSVIVIHTTTTGNFPAQTVKIRATKVDSIGLFVWGSNGVMIQDLGRIAAFHVPQVISDGNYGGIVAWHDDRDMNNIQSAFIQRISSTGTLYYPVNGAEGSIETGVHNFDPVPAFNSVTGEAYIFWLHTNSLQSQRGLNGQKFSAAGDRLWGNNGIVFKPLSAANTTSISSINAQMGDGRVYVFYLESSASGLNTKVEGFACDASTGSFVWTGDFVTFSNPTQEKLQMVSTVDLYYNCKMSWGDMRSGSQGIYAQDSNPDGQLGNPVVPVELLSFTASVTSNNVTLNWITSSETNNLGFEIQRINSILNSLQSDENTGWENIGFVAGKGTTTESNNYSFTDKTEPGKYNYRLIQIDYDGSFTYSPEIYVEVSAVSEFLLEQNYPNPFNPTTTISWQSPVSSHLTLKVYDLPGREVATLVDEYKPAGQYEVAFNAIGLSSGIYLYKLTAGEFVQTKKLLLLK